MYRSNQPTVTLTKELEEKLAEYEAEITKPRQNSKALKLWNSSSDLQKAVRSAKNVLATFQVTISTLCLTLIRETWVNNLVLQEEFFLLPPITLIDRLLTMSQGITENSLFPFFSEFIDNLYERQKLRVILCAYFTLKNLDPKTKKPNINLRIKALSE
jgi:hypothetical protein